MRFLTIPVCVRMHKETIEGAEELLERYPEEFYSFSHVIRAAVNFFVRERRWLEEDAAYKRTKNKREREGSVRNIS